MLFLLIVDLFQLPLGLDMVQNLEMLAAVELTLASGQKLVSDCARHRHHAILGCLLLLWCFSLLLFGNFVAIEIVLQLSQLLIRCLDLVDCPESSGYCAIERTLLITPLIA